MGNRILKLATAALAVALTSPALAATCQNTVSFERWLETFKKDAVTQGISPQVIAAATRDIQINKSGFERYVALAARRNRVAYGLTCVLLSLGLGWAAAAAFRRRF